MTGVAGFIVLALVNVAIFAIFAIFAFTPPRARHVKAFLPDGRGADRTCSTRVVVRLREMITIRDATPVVVLDVEGDLTVDDVRELKRMFSARTARERYALFVDGRRAARPSPIVRAELSKLVQDLDPNDKRCFATAVVVQSPLVAGVLTALLWFRPKDRAPLRSFSAVSQALAWLQELNGAPLPSVSIAALDELDRKRA
jgi:hypothetical protein